MREEHRTLEQLLVVKLQALLDVEDRLQHAWPRIAKGATHASLKAIVRASSQQTQRNRKLIEKSFGLLGRRPHKLEGEAIRGLISDAKWVLDNVRDKRARDANLVAALQYIMHYQIAGYGSARAWAETLTRTDVEKLIRQSLNGANVLDRKLSAIATSKLNRIVTFE
jgi:ferritin-like metal-binding protein YciE